MSSKFLSSNSNGIRTLNQENTQEEILRNISNLDNLNTSNFIELKGFNNDFSGNWTTIGSGILNNETTQEVGAFSSIGISSSSASDDINNIIANTAAFRVKMKCINILNEELELEADLTGLTKSLVNLSGNIIISVRDIKIIATGDFQNSNVGNIYVYNGALVPASGKPTKYFKMINATENISLVTERYIKKEANSKIYWKNMNLQLYNNSDEIEIKIEYSDEITVNDRIWFLYKKMLIKDNVFSNIDLSYMEPVIMINDIQEWRILVKNITTTNQAFIYASLTGFSS
jgi:hypothetical protein